MLYFIPWVVFILFLFLSIPIASVMDKKRAEAGMYGGSGGYDSAGDAGSAASADYDLEPDVGYGGDDDIGGDAFL